MCNERYVAETYENKKFKVEIIQDFDPEDPREWDNIGTMVCWHSRYNLGDKHSYEDAQEWLEAMFGEYNPDIFEMSTAIDNLFKDGTPTFDRLQQMQADFDKARKEAYDKWIHDNIAAFEGVILTLYLLDHSGLSMRANSGWCEDPGGWDTSRVGLIYATKEKIIEEYGEYTEETRKKTEACLYGDVETYSQYLSGDVWGYKIEDQDEDELDSCWGFYGSDPKENGMWDNFSEEIRKLIDPEYEINEEGYFLDNQMNLPLEVVAQ